MKTRVIRTALTGLIFLTALLIYVSSASAQTAESTYKAKCAGCHGDDGSGSTPAGKAVGARDFHSPDVQKETNTELADIISKGKNKMPKYSDKLKDAEIKDLAAYVHELAMKK